MNVDAPVAKSKVKAVCYFCGGLDPDSREDIPGKLFGVNHQTGGLLVPAHKSCNVEWNVHQQSFRQHLVIHRGSSSGAHYMQLRELLRLKGTNEKLPQIGRWMKAKAKIFPIEDKLYIGMTEDDQEIHMNVLRHWAAGIHYSQKQARAALPGTVFMVEPGALSHETFAISAHEWRTTDGEILGYYWFLPGSEPSDSITIFHLLDSDELWFIVKFPKTLKGDLLTLPKSKPQSATEKKW